MDNKDKDVVVELIPIEQEREAKAGNGKWTIHVNKDLSFNMVFVREPNCQDYKKRYPEVRGFWIGETVVTQSLFKAVMGKLPEPGDDVDGDKQYFNRGGDYPVVYSSRDIALQFIGELNRITRKEFRLPTSAEWEFAARGGNKSNGYMYSGSNNVDDVAWYNRNSYKHIHPVGEKQCNELGLYDMSGNVYEWTNDKHADYGHITRGGSCDQDETRCKVTYSSNQKQNFVMDNLGFRLAMTR